MATKQQKVDKILRLARQVGEQVDLPRQALLQAHSQDLDFLITTLQSRLPEARQQVSMVQAQVPQSMKKSAKAGKAPGKKLMKYLKFRAMAMKNGLTEAQTKRAYATYKQIGNAQQAVAAHVTPAAQQRAEQRMQQRLQQMPVSRKPAKAGKAPGEKLMKYLKFRAMAMKNGLTEAQTKRAYATYKQIGNAQQAVAAHVTPAAEQRAEQRMQQRLQQAPVSRKSAKAFSKKPKAKRTKIPNSIAQRAAALSRAIAEGKIAVRQGKTSPSDYTSGTARQKAERFVSLYKGTRVSGIKRTPEQRAGLKAVYQSIRDQDKKPYYLSKGYTVTIKAGGGPNGPGIIRKLPGYPVLPFSKLFRDEQEEVIRFLNTKEGKKLRAKGAKSKKASLQKLLDQVVA